jgi:peroxin-6
MACLLAREGLMFSSLVLQIDQTYSILHCFDQEGELCVLLIVWSAWSYLSFRFDRMLYLGVSDSHDAQSDILQALTRKFRLDDALDLRLVAQQCPFNYTGADFYALCSDAMLTAMSRKAEELEVKIGAWSAPGTLNCIDAPAAILNKEPGLHGNPHPLTPQYYLAEMAAPEDTIVIVTQEDFDQAVRDLVPSVSQSEMDRYASIQKRFSRTKPIAIDGVIPSKLD